MNSEGLYSFLAVKGSMDKKAQAAMEYLLVVAFAVGMIGLGLTAFFHQSSEVAKDMDIQRVNELAINILEQAKNIHYAGGYSKKIISQRVPNSVDKIEVIDEGGIYKLVFTVQTKSGVSEIVYDSDVPIEGTFPTTPEETQEIARFIIEKDTPVQINWE